MAFVWGVQAKTHRITKNEYPAEKNTQKGLIIKQLCFIAVLGFGAINSINTHLSGVLPSIITFPIINGGVILATTILSTIIFKEKLSLIQKIGIVIGVVSILCITIADVLV